MWQHRRTIPIRDLLPWLPTLAGVAGLIALLVIAAVRFTAQPDLPITPAPQPALPDLLPPTIAPVTSPAPTSSPTSVPALSPTSAPAFSPTSSPASPAPRSSPPPRRPRPSPPAVTGAYRVVQSFGDGFIGEVLIRNATDRDRDWRADLRFPDAGRLITSWVESAPQATLTASGDRFVWSSGVPVPAGGEVALRFHFSRDGTVDRPASCQVNGTTCTTFR
jgi:cellulose binding protein with CBM2 domain